MDLLQLLLKVFHVVEIEFLIFVVEFRLMQRRQSLLYPWRLHEVLVVRFKLDQFDLLLLLILDLLQRLILASLLLIEEPSKFLFDPERVNRPLLRGL